MRDVWLQIVRSGLAPEFAAFAIWMALSVFVGLTKSGGGGLRGGAKRVLRELSVATHEDEPGTFTAPRLLRRLVRAAVRSPEARGSRPSRDGGGPVGPGGVR